VQLDSEVEQHGNAPKQRIPHAARVADEQSFVDALRGRLERLEPESAAADGANKVVDELRAHPDGSIQHDIGTDPRRRG